MCGRSSPESTLEHSFATPIANGIANSFNRVSGLVSLLPEPSRATATMLSTCALHATSHRVGKQCATQCPRYSISWRMKRMLAYAPYWPLDVRLHPSVSGWKRTDGPFPNERHACV